MFPNFPKFLRFRYTLRKHHCFSRTLIRNICVQGANVLNYPVNKTYRFPTFFVCSSNTAAASASSLDIAMSFSGTIPQIMTKHDYQTASPSLLNSSAKRKRAAINTRNILQKERNTKYHTKFSL